MNRHRKVQSLRSLQLCASRSHVQMVETCSREVIYEQQDVRRCRKVHSNIEREATPDDTAYAMNLYVSVGTSPSFFHPVPKQMPSDIQQLMDDEEPRPAYIMNKRWDIVGYNRIAPIVFPIIPRLDDPDVRNGKSFVTNVLYFTFLDPDAQHTIDE
jgi:hypothetical protein